MSSSFRTVRPGPTEPPRPIESYIEQARLARAEAMRDALRHAGAALGALWTRALGPAAREGAPCRS